MVEQPQQPQPGRAPAVPPAAPVPAAPQAPGQQPPGGWHQPLAAPDPYAGRYASWWSRAGAWLIDGLITGVPVVVLMIVAFIPLLGSLGLGASGNEGEAAAAALAGAFWFLILLFVGLILMFLIRLFYGALLMQRQGERNGQTWGKQALGIRVVRADGRPYDFGAGLLRDGVVEYLLFWVVGSSLMGIPTLLDYLWPLWDDQNRCLHDMMVDSRVIQA